MRVGGRKLIWLGRAVNIACLWLPLGPRGWESPREQGRPSLDTGHMPHTRYSLSISQQSYRLSVLIPIG